MKYPGQTIEIDHSKSEATGAHHSMIKSVYSRLFDQIVSMVNQNVSVPRRESELQTEEMPSIGLLDIYGFEAYPSGNSFE